MQAQETGQLIKAGTGTFTDKENGREITFGRLQLLKEDENGFYYVQNIKVKRERFALLSEAQKAFSGKRVKVAIDVQQFGNRSDFFATSVEAG